MATHNFKIHFYVTTVYLLVWTFTNSIKHYKLYEHFSPGAGDQTQGHAQLTFFFFLNKVLLCCLCCPGWPWTPNSSVSASQIAVTRLRIWLSDRVLAQHARGPGFGSHHCKKEKHQKQSINNRNDQVARAMDPCHRTWLFIINRLKLVFLMTKLMPMYYRKLKYTDK
jgi:hypothetical protein